MCLHIFPPFLFCSALFLPVALTHPPPIEPGLCLQLALKQLSPGVRVEPCSSAVLQFSVEEIGQLVPLLPNPCTPISTTRWQTEDLDGNKVLFQVSAAQYKRHLNLSPKSEKVSIKIVQCDIMYKMTKCL